MGDLSWGKSSGEISGGKYPKLNMFKKDPIANSIVTKLVSDRTQGGFTPHRRGDQPPAESVIRRISDDVTQNINDSTNIFQLLPDTELAMQILISSILSPKDMINVELGYRVDPSVLESEISGPMIEVVRRHFEDVYKIKKELPKILEECLFTKGSYPLMVLPESSLDAMINSDQQVSVEAFKGALMGPGGRLSSIGLLGPSESNKVRGTFSLEGLGYDNVHFDETANEIKTVDKFKGLLKISDNFESLKLPRFMDKLRQDRISDALGVRRFGMEAAKRDEAKEEATIRNLYRPRNYQRQPYQSVKTPGETGRASQGHPLVMKLPPEAVIPVHVPSNPEDHIGYFLLLDQYGNPLNRIKEADYYRDMSRQIGSGDITSQLLGAARRGADGLGRDSQSSLEVGEAVRIYSEIVERDLLSRLKNGVYGESVEIARPMDVYRVMLARSLANMGTQILYVPAELMTYMAFDHNQFGVGKSLLEDNKILASIRSMLLFSNTMAAIKNSVGRTGLRIQLDPDDPDPSSTVEYMIHEYSRNRQSAYPLGASNPLDIVDFLQNAGIDVQVSGNSAYPETTLDVEDKSTNRVMPDSTLEDDIKNKYFMSLGMSPETIDLSSNVEFATSVVTSNLLLAKRVIIYQDKLTGFLKEHIDKFVRHSSILIEELLGAIEGNKKALGSENRKLEPIQIVELFLGGLEVTLPRPDSAKLENQIQAFDLYSDSLEKAVDAYFGEDSFMLEAFDDVEGDMRAVRAAVISYFKRQWLRNNNVLPELMDLVNVNKDGDPELDLMKIHGHHLESIGKSVSELMENMKADRIKRDKLREKLDAEADAASGDADDAGGDPTGGDDDFGGGDTGGDDDIGGDDAGGDDDGLDLDFDDDDTGGGDPSEEPEVDDTEEEPGEGGEETSDDVEGGDEPELPEEGEGGEEPSEVDDPTETDEPESSDDDTEEPSEEPSEEPEETPEEDEIPSDDGEIPDAPGGDGLGNPEEGSDDIPEEEPEETPEEEPELPEEEPLDEETGEEEPSETDEEEEPELPETSDGDVDGLGEEPEEPSASDDDDIDDLEEDAEDIELPEEPEGSDDNEDGLGDAPEEPDTSDDDEEEDDENQT